MAPREARRWAVAWPIPEGGAGDGEDFGLVESHGCVLVGLEYGSSEGSGWS